MLYIRIYVKQTATAHILFRPFWQFIHIAFNIYGQFKTNELQGVMAFFRVSYQTRTKIQYCWGISSV